MGNKTGWQEALPNLRQSGIWLQLVEVHVRRGVRKCRHGKPVDNLSSSGHNLE